MKDDQRQKSQKKFKSFDTVLFPKLDSTFSFDSIILRASNSIIIYNVYIYIYFRIY